MLGTVYQDCTRYKCALHQRCPTSRVRPIRQQPVCCVRLLKLSPCMVMQPNTFPWHPADALELAARCGVHMPSASTSVLAAVLVLCFLFGVWGWKTVNTFKFYRLGVPAAAQHFLKVHASGVAVVNFWQAGRVTFIARC